MRFTAFTASYVLTLFLRVPGAPLSNNLCERALKKAILHRKNSLFYRTLNGAKVGDLFMSLIHTAELHQVEPFDYLVALLRHEATVALDPAAWMPWNYTATLARLAAAATDPAPDRFRTCRAAPSEASLPPPRQSVPTTTVGAPVVRAMGCRVARKQRRQPPPGWAPAAQPDGYSVAPPFTEYAGRPRYTGSALGIHAALPKGHR